MSRPRALLLAAPYDDVTRPYHSLAYLGGPLRAAGWDVDVIDLNIEWFRSVFTQSQVDAWHTELREAWSALDAEPVWEPSHQERASDLLQALADASFVRPDEAIEVLCSDAFYDYDAYRRARTHVARFERLLSVIHPQFAFHQAFSLPPGEPCAEALLAGVHAADRFVGEVARVLEARSGDRSYEICGVSIPNTTQLRLGLATLRAVAHTHPDARRIAGGAAITDLWRNVVHPHVLTELHPLCDHLAIGECDVRIVDYARWVRTDGGAPPAGIVDLRPGAGAAPVEALRPVPADCWSRPDYGWVRPDLYLAPEPAVCYAPTRGCHWRRCAFCDYGLHHDGAAAPYRALPAERIVEDLRAVAAAGITSVYLAVDAIAPAHLRALATALLEADLGITWWTELRLADGLDADLARLLERAGMVTASFGLESGSSALLERMGKGHGVIEQAIRPALSAVRETGIGLQPKFFFDFPGETEADRRKTVDLLLDHRDVFAIVTRPNRFGLLPFSQVAKDPAAFGIAGIKRLPGDDLAGGLTWHLADESTRLTAERYGAYVAELAPRPTFERPWAGGIDTFHTFLYLRRFGREVFHDLRATHADDVCIFGPPVSVTVRSHFDVEAAWTSTLIRRWDRARRPAAWHARGPSAADVEAALETTATPLARKPHTVHATVPIP